MIKDIKYFFGCMKIDSLKKTFDDIKNMFTNRYIGGHSRITKAKTIGNCAIYICKSFRPHLSETIIPISVTLWKKNEGELWDEWGQVYLDFRVFNYFICCRVKIGTKTSLVPRWLM